MGVKKTRRIIDYNHSVVESRCEDCDKILIEKHIVIGNPPKYITYCPSCKEEFLLSHRAERYEFKHGIFGIKE